jgi:DNA invertase Pin-like site-specific DNA recombinase
MSSNKQEASPQQQRDAIEAYAVQHGYRIIAWYVDEGISGDATEKRLQFQRMIADADNGKFKAILCWNQDRFGRFNSLEAGHWVYPLVQAGISLVTCDAGLIDWNDFTGRMMYAIQQEGKHQFLRDLSRNTMRGKLAAAKRGDWLGKPPIGYILKNKRLVLGDPAEIQIVQDIFAWYLGGESVRGITRRLNEIGKTTSSGKPWIPSTIQNILKRVTYAGTYKWNKRTQGKYHQISDGKVCDSTPNGSNSGDWIVIPDNHPAIIDRQTFNAVQQRLTERKRRTTPHKNGGRFVLTGLIRCGKCGGRMFGTIPNKGQQVSYVCSTEHLTGQCDRNGVKQDELLRHVVDTVVERFTNPDVAERLRNESYRQVQATSRKTNPDAIGRQMAAIDKNLTKAKRRLLRVDDDMVPVVSDHIRELTGKRDALQVSLKAAQTPVRTRLADIDVRVNRAMEGFTRLRETLQAADPVRLRELLAQTIDKVEVWSNPVMRGRRRVFQLERGVIHLRSDELNKLTSSSYR